MEERPDRKTVGELCDRMSALYYIVRLEGMNEQERTVYCVSNLDVQVTNDGFGKFLLRSGWIAAATLEALERIGLPRTREALERALSIFPDGVEPDDDDDWGLLGWFAKALSPEERNSFLAGMDRRFRVSVDEDLRERLSSYIAAHPGAFRDWDWIESRMLEGFYGDLLERLTEESKEQHRFWNRKERPCPWCGTRFVTAVNLGKCPRCGNVFFASDPNPPDITLD